MFLVLQDGEAWVTAQSFARACGHRGFAVFDEVKRLESSPQARMRMVDIRGGRRLPAVAFDYVRQVLENQHAVIALVALEAR